MNINVYDVASGNRSKKFPVLVPNLYLYLP